MSYDTSTEGGVSFTIDVQQTVSDAALKEMIDKAVDERMRQMEADGRLTGPAGPAGPGGGEPAPSPEPGGPGGRGTGIIRGRGGKGLISEYGYGHEPKKHYIPRPQPRRVLPPTGDAPFTEDFATIPGFGGSSYVAPRGFQQEKVNRRGAIRKNYARDHTAVGGIQPQSIRDAIRELQLQQAEMIEERQEGGQKAIQAVRQFAGPQSEAFTTILQGITNPAGLTHTAIASALHGLAGLAPEADVTSKAAIAAEVAKAKATVDPATERTIELRKQQPSALPKGDPRLGTTVESAEIAEDVATTTTTKPKPKVGSSPNAAEAKAMLDNPKKWQATNMLGLLAAGGPYGIAIAAAITSILATPEFAKTIINFASKKGGPLNRDWQIDLEEAVSGFLNYTDQHKRDIGLSSFVVSQAIGYGFVEGTDVRNSLRDVDEYRISEIPLEQR